MILREMAVTLLCLVSIVGGSVSTARALAVGAPPNPPALVAAITPEAFTAWATAIANALPVLVAAAMLAWDRYRSQKRKIEAADAAALKARLEAKSGEVEALKAHNDLLTARLDDAEHAAKTLGRNHAGPAEGPADGDGRRPRQET